MLRAIRLPKNSSLFVKHDYLFPCWQRPASYHYADRTEFSVKYTPFINHFNIYPPVYVCIYQAFVFLLPNVTVQYLTLLLRMLKFSCSNSDKDKSYLGLFEFYFILPNVKFGIVCSCPYYFHWETEIWRKTRKLEVTRLV
jgi:hypothetical protein